MLPPSLKTTLYSAERELCRGYGQATCQIDKPDDETISYKTTLNKPKEGRYSFAYCMTGGDNVEYIIDWEG
nr:unnamed protein product [Spirometra erinaceieuropaei]